MILQIAIAVLSVLAMFAVAGAVRWLGRRYAVGAETQRKVVHVGVGIHAMLLPLVLQREGFFVFAALAAVALLVLRLPWIAREGIGASLHSVERRSWGDVLFVVAVAVLFLRSAGDSALYTLPIAVLTLSDAAAALVGTEYGRRRFGTGDRVKSIEGSVAFFVVTWMVVVGILIAATDIPRENVIWLGTLVSAFATHVEADSWRGLDNLFVPVGIHVLLVSWAGASPTLLAAITIGWLALLFVAQQIAASFGMTPHAARAASIAFFLSVLAAEPVNAILPVLAFLAALAARPAAEDDEDPILDFVAALVLIGIVWLAIGSAFGRNAIAFYSATFAALAAGYAVLTLSKTRFHWVGALAAVAAVILVYLFLLPAITDGMGWTPSVPMLAVASLATALTAAVAVAWPASWSTAAPGLRLAATALIALLPVYVFEALA